MDGLGAALLVQFLRNLHSPAIVVKDGRAQGMTFRIRHDKRPRSGRDRHSSKLYVARFLLQAFDNHLANGAHGLPPFVRVLLVDSPWGAVVLPNLLIRFRQKLASGTDCDTSHSTGSHINSNHGALLIALHSSSPRLRPSLGMYLRQYATDSASRSMISVGRSAVA